MNSWAYLVRDILGIYRSVFIEKGFRDLPDVEKNIISSPYCLTYHYFYSIITFQSVWPSSGTEKQGFKWCLGKALKYFRSTKFNKKKKKKKRLISRKSTCTPSIFISKTDQDTQQTLSGKSVLWPTEENIKIHNIFYCYPHVKLSVLSEWLNRHI